MTKDPPPLRQPAPKPLLGQALEMAIKLMDSEIRHLGAACDSARYGLEYGLRAVERRNLLIQYRDELQRLLETQPATQRMLNEQNNP